MPCGLQNGYKSVVFIDLFAIELVDQISCEIFSSSKLTLMENTGRYTRRKVAEENEIVAAAKTAAALEAAAIAATAAHLFENPPIGSTFED